ncbi:unnamed protein product [Pleuronectes platessa]|uniref:Uncharacterized protein n=1 Tax=Pleuronectes platessa TaxID=8262 RepID=A0A9N7UWQ9_PLEPL|nr:unnamed protein product [Pleuronectes platessa]
MPHISNDPLPRGLCSSPSSQRWSAPGGHCIPCHKSTFLHNRATEDGPQHSGSPRVSTSSPSLDFRPPPFSSRKHPHWWGRYFAQAWQRYQRDLELLVLPPRRR